MERSSVVLVCAESKLSERVMRGKNYAEIRVLVQVALRKINKNPARIDRQIIFNVYK
jgi:hypothetical protein